MSTTQHAAIFVNLPVKDLPKSRTFFEALGYNFEAKFTNEHAACLVLGGNLYAMLLTEPMFAGFAPNPVADARRSTEVMTCLQCESRAQVDALVAKALAAGGSTHKSPQDHGFMYGHGFQDPDGHGWELMWMDPSASPAG